MSHTTSQTTEVEDSSASRLEEVGEHRRSIVQKWTWRAVVRQIAIVGLSLAAYLTVRALTVGSESSAFQNATRLLDFERSLGFDWEAGIQQAALEREWLITAANWIYSLAYWPILIVTLIYTWFWQRPLFHRFRNTLFVSGLMGLAVFALFPVAPPRFLSGYVDTVSVAARHQYIAQPTWLINENAALPSFHVGWVALASVLMFSVVKRPLWRFVISLPALIMAGTVVITGNHYVIDILAGVLVSLVALLIIVWAERRPAVSRNY